MKSYKEAHGGWQVVSWFLKLKEAMAQALLKRKVDVKILCLAVTYCPRSQGSYECKGKVGRETVYLPNMRSGLAFS